MCHIDTPKRKAKWSCSVAARAVTTAQTTEPEAVVTATRSPVAQVSQQVAGASMRVPAPLPVHPPAPVTVTAVGTGAPASTATAAVPAPRHRKRTLSPSQNSGSELVDSRQTGTADFSSLQPTTTLHLGASTSHTSPHPSRSSKAS